jgi:hypothetical protein
MPSIRENIVSAFATRLSAARASRTSTLALWDDGDTNQGRQFNLQLASIECRVEHQETVADIDTLSERANVIAADIIGTAMQPDRTLSDTCRDIELTNLNISWPEPNSRVLGVTVEFQIHYQHDLGDPNTNTNPI